MGRSRWGSSLVVFLWACGAPQGGEAPGPQGGDSGDPASSPPASDTGVAPGTFRLVGGVGGPELTEVACEWDEADCPSSCDGNTAPVLSEPEVWVNGVPGVAPSAGDEVVVVFPFEDAEDNLRCGSRSESVRAPSMMYDSAESLCSNHPASTAASGVGLGVSFTLDEAGAYSVSLKLADVCGAESERREWSWGSP